MKSTALEMSLKPFKKTDDLYIREVVRKLFCQWTPLIGDTQTVKVMLWTADGSELFDYTGREEDTFEWAYFLGGANQREGNDPKLDPDGVGLHTRNYLYTDNPPVMNYRILKKIVATIKEEGKKAFPEKEILVGTTVDPGPEFAISDFKYERHNELCTGGAMGKATMLCAYEKMHSDNYSYAAYPKGVPEGLEFGTFFGKQAEIFTKDMGFDYIWLSNGLGFGRETWSDKGAIFDGEKFDCSELNSVREDVLKFWKLFRSECPDLPIETRGTNMSLGIDLATDAVPLKSIYDSVPGFLPPPNSPWAALNGNYGLEIMGYMSRIAHVPDNRYLFRYYLHDIWWVNSPWYDRYNGQPHDIYIPLSVARIDRDGNIQPPTDMNILSVDNSFGELPDACANEAIPHMLKAFREVPDKAAPIVWIYPFNEYSDARSEAEMQDMYFEDKFIEGVINCGVPISMVTATDSFSSHDKSIYKSSILITPVPFGGSEFEDEIIKYARSGGRVIFYGSMRRSGEKFRKLTGVDISGGVSGKVALEVLGKHQGEINHIPVTCGGDIDTQGLRDNVFARAGGKTYAIFENSFAWVRGTLSGAGGYKAEGIVGKLLEKMGFCIRFENPMGVESPKLSIHRHSNAYILSQFTPYTVVETQMKLPLGAPIFDCYSAEIKDGFACYRFPKSEHKECRIFVEQGKGVVTCREEAPCSAQFRRSIGVYGLENATLNILAEDYCSENVSVYARREGDYMLDKIEGKYVTVGNDRVYRIENITGKAFVYMPYKKELH